METLMDEVHITSPASTAHVPPPGIQPVSPPKPKEDPKPNPYQPKIPYPLRLYKTKLFDKNDVQVSKFLKIFKQLRFDISLMDALTQIPTYAKVLKDLLKNKEKLEELANTLINVECSTILLNKVLEKLRDPEKFLIPCILQDLEVCNSLADFRASINLMALSIYEKLGIGPLKPTRMTLELANRSVTYSMGIAEDVIVKDDIFNFLAVALSIYEKLRIGPLKPTRMTLELANRSVTYSMGIAEDVIVKDDIFNFLADFVIVDFKADPRVPIILGRPFLRTAKALVDLYEEKLTLRIENEELIFCTKIFSNNSPSREPFCFDINHQEEKSSGSITSRSDHSLLDYEAFCFDINHYEEKSSGTTTSYFNHSLLEYESFYFDLSIDPFLLPKGVILIIRSSPMNSLTSYLHRRRKDGSSKNTYSKLSGRGLSSRSVGDSDSEFSWADIAMNSSNSGKSFSLRMVHSMEWRISLPSSRRASKSSSKISSMTSILKHVSSFHYRGWNHGRVNHCKMSMTESLHEFGSSSRDMVSELLLHSTAKATVFLRDDLFLVFSPVELESRSKRAGEKNQLIKAVRSSSHVLIVPSLSSSSQVLASPEFVNVLTRIGFGSSIELVSFDKSQVVTFNGKFVCGFRNGDCETRSRSDNTVGSPHGFIIHGIEVLKSNEKVTKVIDVDNWRIDNSRVLRWIVSLFEWNSSVSSKNSSIQRSYTLSWKPCQEYSSKLSLPDHRYKQRCCFLISAKSNSLPHAHAQTTKTYYKHQDSRINKA
nr:hypothetical protein [Tanacetum cinerariifolium]